MANSVLASMSVVLGANIAQFEKNMAIAKKNLSGFVKASDKLKDVGTSMSMYITAPLLAVGGIALKAAGDMQALEKGFAATYKGAGDLNEELRKTREVAKLPGLGLKEAIQGATNLQAVGYAAEESRRILMGYRNALATVGKGKADLSGVVTALSQMAAKGKVSAEEINQIAERVPQIRQVMKNVFGTADTEELQKMGISVEEFVAKTTTELNKLPKVTGGINNAFENMSDAGFMAVSSLGTAINKNFNIEGLFNKVSDAITRVVDRFNAMSPAAQKVILISAGVVAAIGPIAVVMGTVGAAVPSIVAGFKMIGTAAKSMSVLFSPLALKVVAVTAAVAGLALIGKSIYDSWDTVAAFFDRMWAQVKNTFAQSIKVIVDNVAGFAGVFGIEMKGAQAAVNAFAKSTQENLDSKPYVSFGETMSEIGGNIVKNLNSITGSVTGFFAATSDNVATAADEVEDNADRINNALKGIKPPAPIAPVQSETPEVKNSGDQTGSIFDIVKGFEAVPVALAPASEAMNKFFADQAENINHFGEIKDTVLSYAQNMSDGVASAISSFSASIGAGTASLADFGQSLLNVLSQLGKQVGEYFIKMGIPMLLSGNPIGGALIAAGGVLSAFSGALASAGGSGGGGSLAPSVSMSGSAYRQPNTGTSYGRGGETLRAEIEGNKLVMLLERENYRTSRYRG